MNKIILVILALSIINCQKAEDLVPVDATLNRTSANVLTQNLGYISGCSSEYSSGGIYTGCSACKSGYMKVKSATNYNYFYCLSCISGCDSCRDPNICDSCSSSYYKNAQQVCIICSSITPNC